MSSNLLIALAALAVQTAPPPAPSPAYSDPPVRPFEPTGPLVTGAEAEAGSQPLRHPPEDAVRVEAYRGQYESPPSAVERAYDRGVVQAEITMDSRMGPLDGRWRVLDQDGETLFTLVLADEGSGAIEGAWRDRGGHMGVAASTPRDDGRAAIVLDGRCELVLAPSGSGFTGVLIREGREQPIRLSRT